MYKLYTMATTTTTTKFMLTNFNDFDVSVKYPIYPPKGYKEWLSEMKTLIIAYNEVYPE